MKKKFSNCTKHKKALEKGEYLQGTMPYHQKRYGPAQGGKREANDAPIARRRTAPKKFTIFLLFGENISGAIAGVAFRK